MKETDRYVAMKGQVYDLENNAFLSTGKIIELLNNLEEIKQWEIDQELTPEDIRELLEMDDNGC